jgi:hypothetical protein
MAQGDEKLSGLRSNWTGGQHESRYRAGFAAMADRGQFWFDIDFYLKPGGVYFRVACPAEQTLAKAYAALARIYSRTVREA